MLYPIISFYSGPAMRGCWISVWMGSKHLWFSSTKTKWLWLSGITRFRDVPSLSLDEVAIPPSRLVCNLELFLDTHLLLNERWQLCSGRPWHCFIWSTSCTLSWIAGPFRYSYPGHLMAWFLKFGLHGTSKRAMMSIP